MSYIFNFLKTGAVRKTPQRIIKKILSETEPGENPGFIEFGAGKGEITSLIVERAVGKSITYYAFEIDKNFVTLLEKTIPGIHIISSDAFQFETSLPPGFKSDYIICSIPLSFYKKPDINQLLQKMQSRLKENGKIFILLHAFWLIPFLRKQLPKSRLYRYNTLPLYFLLIFNK